MVPSNAIRTQFRRAITISALTAIALAGCKSKAPDDATLAANTQAALAADTAIAGQPIQTTVQGGVVTLSGTVSNDAQRTLAARDAAAVPGVAKVQDDITVDSSNPTTASLSTPPPAPPPPTPAPAPVSGKKPSPATPAPHQAAPIERPQEAFNNAPPPQPQQQPQPEPQPQTQPEQATPPPPPQPTYKTVTIASGETIPVRITQTLDSASTQPNTTFSGVTTSDIVVDGLVAIPAGSAVSGHVDDVKDAAHFKGSASLTVSLASITRRGEHLAITTEPYSVQGKGRGVNTAEKTGGGAAVGAILGGIFGGGKGAAIGAAAGAGAGAGSNAITRGQQVQIASESVVRFHLSSPVTVKVRTDGGERHPDDGGLQQHANP
jgi:outer membrane biosynthesis protein TonB